MPKGAKGITKVNCTCAVCGKDFLARARKVLAKTCSQACGNLARAGKLREQTKLQEKQVECQCGTCGGKFTVPECRASTAKYCSKECLYSRNDTKRACECCGKEFRTPPSQMRVRTCSPECGYKVREVNDQRLRLVCKHCGAHFLESPSRADSRIYCSKECQMADPDTLAAMSARVSGERNPGWQGGIGIPTVSASGRKYTRQSPAKENAKDNARRASKLQATVAWADKEKIEVFYEEAQRISKSTGMVYHVDHIVPLTSKKVCGLHNEFNLQVIPALENLRKHNRHWPDM